MIEEHITDKPAIPPELEPLAEEARKYKNAEEFQQALKKRIHIEELGDIKSKWISLPNLPLMNMGRAEEPDSVIIQRGLQVYKDRMIKNQVQEKLRGKYPLKQIFEGTLPTYDVEFTGKPNWYLYVLKDRKRRGKYQVEEAIELPKIAHKELDLKSFWQIAQKASPKRTEEHIT